MPVNIGSLRHPNRAELDPRSGLKAEGAAFV
jgi:hypothetical protein